MTIDLQVLLKVLLAPDDAGTAGAAIWTWNALSSVTSDLASSERKLRNLDIQLKDTTARENALLVVTARQVCGIRWGSCILVTGIHMANHRTIMSSTSL